MKPLYLCLLALPLLIGCKQELPRQLDEPNAFGTLQEVKVVQSEKQLIYQGGADPYKQNWGTATGYYVKIDDKMYPVLWDEAEKLKGLKAGDKVNLHPSEFIACVGENDLKPECRRLMRVFKGERRINPLQHK